MNISREGALDLSVVKSVSETAGESRIRRGDVLFNNTNSPELVGKTTYINIDGEFAYSNHMTRVRVDCGISAAFLAYQLHFLWSAGYFRHRCTNHVNQASISSKVLADTVPVVVPPRDEQDRVVAEIEKQFTRIDAAQHDLRRAFRGASRLRWAVLDAAVNGRLVRLDDVPTGCLSSGAETLEAVLAEREKQHGRAHPAMTANTDRLPELPPCWSWASLDQVLTSLRNGVSLKPTADSGTPILRINAVRPLSVDLSEVRFLDAAVDGLNNYMLHEGDLLFTRYNGSVNLVGVCGRVPRVNESLVYPDKLIRGRVVSAELVSPRYLEIAANAGASRRFIASRVRTTAGQAGVSGGDLKRVPIPLPPPHLQRRIADEVSRRLAVIQATEASINRQLALSRSLRQAVLRDAFNGSLIDSAATSSAIL
jgi:type I restriction enzyme S subunit